MKCLSVALPLACPGMPLAALLVLVALLAAGCGGGGDGGDDPDPVEQAKRGEPVLGQSGDEEPAGPALGFPVFATKNTTRVAGGDPTADAAAVAQAVYPSRTRDTRPRAVVLVDQDDWRAGISAAQLMGRPLRAPVLFAEGDELPEATAEALEKLGPTGAKEAGGAQVIRIGEVAKPDGLKTSDVTGANPAATARAIDRLQTSAAGKPSAAVLVAPADRPDFAMPAAGWAARSGDPVLWAGRDALPAETRAAIQGHKRPRIYVLGPPEAISEKVVGELGKLGTVKRIAGADPVANAIAFARFTDGRFGWGVVDPGHGFVFASARRTLDAAAGGTALGRGHLRPAAAAPGRPGAAAAAPGVPARPPARVRRGPGARRLQSRLADGRRDRHLGGRAVAHRHPPRDPVRRDRRRLTEWPKPSSPSACGPSGRSRWTTSARSSGASTPHFALQIRNRIRKLIAALPPDDPARVAGEREIARLERIAFTGETRGEGHADGERPLPSLDEHEQPRRVEGATKG